MVQGRFGTERPETAERLIRLVAGLLLIVGSACGASGPSSGADTGDGSAAAAATPHSTGAPAVPVEPAPPISPGEFDSLIWYVADGGGARLDGHDGERSINPASVVKVATSLWALERLGTDHRFETRFVTNGTVDPARGLVDGDLIVLGGADPDFHVENAFLVARALNDAGIHRVTGDLRVDERFWIGWEGGSEKREHDRARRTSLMAGRLEIALDAARRNPTIREAFDELIERRGWALDRLPSISIDGVAGRYAGGDSKTSLVIHRSGRLVSTLKRFNAWSNNDIERFGVTLGSASDLASFLTERWGGASPTIRLASLSGLGTNRMSPRQLVRLLQDLQQTADELGLTVGDLLPVGGCDPGTLNNFPNLKGSGVAQALIGKTGTLRTTDGGVAALAGYLETARGGLIFGVVAPGAGSRLTSARDEQERFVFELAARYEGTVEHACGPPPPHSDAGALVELTESPAALSSARIP